MRSLPQVHWSASGLGSGARARTANSGAADVGRRASTGRGPARLRGARPVGHRPVPAGPPRLPAPPGQHPHRSKLARTPRPRRGRQRHRGGPGTASAGSGYRPSASCLPPRRRATSPQHRRRHPGTARGGGDRRTATRGVGNAAVTSRNVANQSRRGHPATLAERAGRRQEAAHFVAAVARWYWYTVSRLMLNSRASADFGSPAAARRVSWSICSVVSAFRRPR